MQKQRKNADTHGGKRPGSGRKPAYPGEGLAVRRSFSAPAALASRLTVAAEQVGCSESTIVVAGLRQILDQSPDRLQDVLRDA